MNIIGGYYGRSLEGIADEVAEWREMGFRGCKFKVGGRTPAEDAERVHAARAAAGDDFVLTIDANQGYTVHEALDLCRRVSDLGVRWFEEPCIWTNDRRDMRDVRVARRHPGVRGPERVLAGRLPRPDGGGRDRRVQLRRVVERRLHQLAPHGLRVAALQRAARPPRGAPGRGAPAREPVERDVSRGVPPGPGPDLVEPRREPAAGGRRARRRCRPAPASAGSWTATSSPGTASRSEVSRRPRSGPRRRAARSRRAR